MRKKKDKEYWQDREPNMPGTLPKDGLVSTQILSYYLNIEERTVKGFIIQNGIPVAKIGGKWLIRLENVPFEKLETNEKVQ